MDDLDALALLDVARMQTVHPAPSIDIQKVAYAFAVVVSRGNDRSWE